MTLLEPYVYGAAADIARAGVVDDHWRYWCMPGRVSAPFDHGMTLRRGIQLLRVVFVGDVDVGLPVDAGVFGNGVSLRGRTGDCQYRTLLPPPPDTLTVLSPGCGRRAGGRVLGGRSLNVKSVCIVLFENAEEEIGC